MKTHSFGQVRKHGEADCYGGATSAVSFSPIILSSLAAWWDASDISTLYQDNLLTTPVTTDNQTVGGIKDKSGNNRHAIQATAGKRPTYKSTGFSGRPYLQSAGAERKLVATFSINQPNTVFVVCRYAVISANQSPFDGSVGARHLFVLTGSPAKYSINAGTSLNSTANADDEHRHHTAVFNGANSYYRLDGTQIAAGNTNTNALTNPVLFGPYTAAASEIDLAEVLVYNRELTASEILAVEGYLTGKWPL